MKSDQRVETARQFMQALFPQLGETNLIEVRVKVGAQGLRRWFFPSITDALQLAFEKAPAADVYFGVAARKHARGGTRKDLSYVRALWADIDSKCFVSKEKASQALARFEFPPSIVVASGGGFHGFWLLSDPFFFQDDARRIDQVEGIMRGILQRLQTHDGRPLDRSWDAPRILRIPGTLNHKYDPAAPVNVVKFNSVHYSIAELERLFVPGPETDQSEVAFGESDVDGHDALQRAVKAGLTTRIIHLIKTGNAARYDGDRSRRDAGVITGLLSVGASPDDILAIFETFPVGDKFLGPNMGQRYLTQTIRKVQKYLATNPVRPRLSGLPRELIEQVAANAVHFRLRKLIKKLQGGAATVRQLQSQLGWARHTVEKHIRIGLKLNMVEVVAEGAAASEGRTRGRPPRLYRLSPSAEAKGVRFLNMTQWKIKRILFGEAP